MDNSIETIFFDLGNTLINYHRGRLSDEEKDFLGIKKMCDFLSDFDNELTFDKLYKNFYLAWLEKLKLRPFQLKEYDVFKFLYDALSNEGKNNINEEHLVIAFKSFHEPNIRFVEYDKNLEYILSLLKNKKIKLGIISNSPIPGYCHDETLRKINILKYFENRFYSYDLNFRKPNKEIFNYAIKNMNTSFSKSIFIGDSLEIDVIPALNLNMKVIWVNNKKLNVPNEIICNENFLGEINKISELKNIKNISL